MVFTCNITKIKYIDSEIAFDSEGTLDTSDFLQHLFNKLLWLTFKALLQFLSC